MSPEHAVWLAEDAMRFQVEAVAHELRNPGWFKEGWILPSQLCSFAERAHAMLVNVPLCYKKPLIHVSSTRKNAKCAPEQSAMSLCSMPSLKDYGAVQRLAMSEASPLYKKLTEEEKAAYVKLAEGTENGCSTGCLLSMYSPGHRSGLQTCSDETPRQGAPPYLEDAL